jgi:prepilin-type processing-associated H-X9-DG protein
MQAIGNYASTNSDGAVQVSSQEIDGRTVHTFAIMPLAMMQIMPTWTIVDDYLVVGMNGPLCSAAVKQITAENRRASSIRETDGYKKATEGIPGELVYISYTDSKVQFNQMMMSAQQFWPMVTMMAANAGVKLPFMLPSLSQIAEKMGPSCEYCWFDKDGLRSRYKGTGVEQSIGIGAAAGAGFGAAILMPALHGARDKAQSVVSANNIRQIQLGLLVYSNDHDGKLPESIDDEEVIKYMGFASKKDAAKVFESPRKPKDFVGPSYIMVPVEKVDIPEAGKIILLYENPQFCKKDINVGFVDGHAESMKKEEFIEALKKTYERLGREMPEIKFGSYSKNYERYKDTEKQKQIGLDENVNISKELSKALEERDIARAKEFIGQHDIAELSYVEKKYLMRLSAYTGDMFITKLLIENGFNTNEDLGMGWTALHYAVRLGHIDLVQYLIDNNADIHLGTEEQMTPLMLAISHKRKDIEKILIENGSKTDAFCETIRGNKKAVEEFIRDDPNVIFEIKGHFTLLHWAAYKGHMDIAKLLIDEGADVNVLSEYVTPLFWAVRYNRTDMAQLLIDNGADVNLRLKGGMTVLHYAAAPEIARFLIDNGADMNAKSEYGATPLHMIVMKTAHHEALRTIIDYNDVIADVKSEEIINKAVQQQLEVVELLIRNGADPQVKDTYGKTPYDYALIAGFESIIEFLSQYNSNNTIS